MENVADEDGTVTIGINATIIKNLTNPATGEAVSLRLTSIGFDGLTSFTKFDPIRPISNYTIGTYVGISSLGMDLNFTLTLTDPTYDENVEETVIVRTGLNETMLEIAIMAALVESEFNAIHLGSLLMSNVDPMDTNSLIDAFWNATRCLMQPLFAVELASLNLTIDNLIEPTLEGIGFETKLISRGTAHDDDRENILSYHWKSGDDVWSDDNTTQWADLGYFEDSAFDVVVRGTKCSHGQLACEDAVTNGSDTLFREIEIPRDAQVFALYSASDDATIGSLLTGWTRCDDAQQYMDAYMIAKAALDAITAQYEAYLETHPWGFDKTPNISRAWTPAHCTDSSITVSPSNWSAAFCSDPSIVDEHFCVGTWDDDGDEFNGTTPNVTRKWSDDGFCTNPEHRTRSSCVGNYTLDDGTIFVEVWLVSSCTDTAVVERSECSGVFTLSRAWSNGRCNDPAVTAEGNCVGNVQLERYWVERGLCNDAKVTIEAQCVGTFDDDDDGHRNGTMPVPRVWHSGTGPACVGPWDPDENPSTPAVERLWIAAACNDPAIATENECVETFDDDQDGGTADVDRTWTCVDSSCRCSDPDVVVQIECAGAWDDDGDGAGHTVFEQLENDLAREESIRDDALASYDPFRGRSAIPTTSDLGAYYVSTTTRTFDACRGYYFDAGTVRLPALDNAALFLRFFPSLSDTASIVTMGIEAMSIVFREVVHPALPSLLHNVIRSTFNRVVRDALADAHSNYNCSVPERRYEEDGSPYIIKWGEKEYDDGQITYSWFANLTHTLVADYISPATALSNSTDANALLSSALPPNGCYPKSHIDGNGSCVGAESMDRSRLVQPETLLQWSTESAITQFSWLRTMTPVHLGFLDGFIANLGLRNLASIKDVTFLEAMSESYAQDPEQTYILKNAISVAGPLIVSVDWFMAWVANISESKRQWTVVSTTDHQGAETVAGCTDPSIESLEIDCKGTWDPSTHATVCPVKKGVFEGTPQCPAQISPLNTFWSNAMEIYAAPKDIFLVFDFMAKISEYKFLTLRLDQLKYPSCWLATFADRCDKVYTDSPPLVAAVKSLRFEIGEMEASINCAIGSEGTMPIRRTWINPSCGVLSDPSSGEQIIYASGQCTGYFEDCSESNWWDEDANVMRSAEDNRASCLEMCSAAGWTGCRYVHGGCNDPSKTRPGQCVGMFDADGDGGFSGPASCHTAPGFEALSKNLKEPEKIVTALSEINRLLGVLTATLSSDNGNQYMSDYLETMTQTCETLSGRKPTLPETTCCVGGWVSTYDCNGTDGTRTYLYDQKCNQVIELDGDKTYSSGYCACEGGRRAMVSSCDERDPSLWMSCNAACDDTREGVPEDVPMTKENVDREEGQWYASNAGLVVAVCLLTVFVLIFVAYIADRCCVRRRSLHFKRGHYLNYSMWSHPVTNIYVKSAVLLEIITSAILQAIWLGGALPTGFVLVLRVIVGGSDFLRIAPLCTISPAVLYNDLTNDEKQSASGVFLISLIYWLLLGAVPIVKIVLRLLVLFMPGWGLVPKRRGRLAQSLDLLNKWSLLDDIAIILACGVVYQNIGSPTAYGILPEKFWSGEIAGYPLNGFYVYFAFSLIGMISNHVMVLIHRDMCCDDITTEELWAIDRRRDRAHAVGGSDIADLDLDIPKADILVGEEMKQGDDDDDDDSVMKIGLSNPARPDSIVHGQHVRTRSRGGSTYTQVSADDGNEESCASTRVASDVVSPNRVVRKGPKKRRSLLNEMRAKMRRPSTKSRHGSIYTEVSSASPAEDLSDDRHSDDEIVVAVPKFETLRRPRQPTLYFSTKRNLGDTAIVDEHFEAISKMRSEALVSHNFQFDEKNGSSRRRFTRIGRACVVGMVVMVAGMLLLALFVPFVTVCFRGLVGVLARMDDSGNKVDQEISILSLAHNFASQSEDNARSRDGDAFGLFWLSFCLTLLCCIFPLLNMCLIAIACVTPLTLRSQKMFFVAVEILSNWATLDVLVVTALAALSPLGVIFELVQIPQCTQIFRPYLQATAVPLGFLENEDTWCYYVYAIFDGFTVFAMCVSSLNFFVTQFALRVLFEVSIANRELKFRLADAEYSHVHDITHTRPCGNELMTWINLCIIRSLTVEVHSSNSKTDGIEIARRMKFGRAPRHVLVSAAPPEDDHDSELFSPGVSSDSKEKKTALTLKSPLSFVSSQSSSQKSDPLDTLAL
eukprot:g1426.t1